MTEYFDAKRIAQIFSSSVSKKDFQEAELRGEVPKGHHFRSGAIPHYGWNIAALPHFGERWGFFPRFPRAAAISVFTTKGGVLKTTLTLNLARVAALHNLKVCVIGLDMQGDITGLMGHNADLEETDNLPEMIQKLNATKGLFDVFNRTARLTDIILPTDLPTLHYIPETPELAAFNESLGHINRREYWLKEKIVEPLKEKYDLIVMDCSPNWNRLITNALVASDCLLSPMECKINNFRNLKVFRHFLQEFQKEMGLQFLNLFIPTRYSQGKKLTTDINEWYRQHIPGCTQQGIRESVMSEEAAALRISLPEHNPTKPQAQEMRELLQEVNQHVHNYLLEQPTSPLLTVNQPLSGDHQWQSV